MFPRKKSCLRKKIFLISSTPRKTSCEIYSGMCLKIPGFAATHLRYRFNSIKFIFNLFWNYFSNFCWYSLWKYKRYSRFASKSSPGYTLGFHTLICCTVPLDHRRYSVRKPKINPFSFHKTFLKRSSKKLQQISERTLG